MGLKYTGTIYTLPHRDLVDKAFTPIGTITEENVKEKRVDIIDPQLEQLEQLGRDL